MSAADFAGLEGASWRSWSEWSAKPCVKNDAAGRTGLKNTSDFGLYGSEVPTQMIRLSPQ